MITPQTEEKLLAKKASVPRLFVKREDLHPYGSHKGRSIPHMIDLHAAKGAGRFAISSSGNAALAAAIHIKKLNEKGKDLELIILVGEKVNKEKLASLQKYEDGKLIVISSSVRPLQELKKLEDKGYTSLRQSTDDFATTGYHALAQELSHIESLEAVFVGMSSGTTLQGLYEGFLALEKRVRLFGVQTTSCHPIAEAFDDSSGDEESIADAIVDITALRRVPVMEAIEDSGGKGLIVNNNSLKDAIDFMKKSGIEATANGAIPLAGLLRAHSLGIRFKGSVALIVGGK